MKKVMLWCVIVLFIVTGLIAWLFIFKSGTKTCTNKEAVIEWAVVSPNDVNLPKLTKTQLIEEIKKTIKTQQAFHSWEAKYDITSRQTLRKQKDWTIPEVVNSSQVYMISNGSKWSYEGKQENKTANKTFCVDTRIISNGKTISMVWPGRKEGQVQDSNRPVFVDLPVLANFLPSLTSELPTINYSFPEVLDILNVSNTNLLPWYTRIDNQTCYVLEQKTTLRHPLFRNKEDVEKWKAANPDQARAWAKAGRYGLVINIDLRPNLEEIREIEMVTRLAVAPHLDFAIVRWAYGYGTNTGNIQGHIFPKAEINYSDFSKVDKSIFIPKLMTYTTYAVNSQEKRQITHETQIRLEEFIINKQYSSEFFEVHFPVGYNIIDSKRGIIYTAGNSENEIDALATAAKTRDDFYNKLRLEESPELEYYKWVNNKPIRLADHKGRPIILHFWSIGCVPCMHELPQLQKQYGHVLENTSSPLFISIHPFANDNELKQLKKVIEKYEITFPIMVDAPDIEDRSWGKTFKKYMVFGIPTNVNIDENGHFAEIDKDYVNKDSRWMKDLGNTR